MEAEDSEEEGQRRRERDELARDVGAMLPTFSFLCSPSDEDGLRLPTIYLIIPENENGGAVSYVRTLSD